MFEEVYSSFKALMKNWIISQLVLDVVFVVGGVVCVTNERMLLFGIVFFGYFIGQIIIITKVFGSVKRFGDYLNINGRYQTAVRNSDDDAIKQAQNDIIEYMKKDTV